MLDWGILILRLGIGIMFTAHGLQMAFGFEWLCDAVGRFYDSFNKEH